MTWNSPRRLAALSLLLLIPAPSLGTLAGMVVFPGTALGAAIFAFSKLWLFALPVVWLKFVEKGRLSSSPVRRGGLGAGAALGFLLSALILAAYALFGRRMMDVGMLADRMRAVGLDSVPRYAAGAAYWILVNSVLEEYVWRWFVVQQTERAVSARAAVPLSALFFTLHHVIALRAFLPPAATALCSAGVFAGGAAWSFLYARYRSIWPAYLSHAIVDLCVFGLGAAAVFQAGFLAGR